MPTISEPQGPLNEASYSRIRQYFIQGLIGEATFEVSLRILGLRNQQEISAEISLAKTERRSEARHSF